MTTDNMGIEEARKELGDIVTRAELTNRFTVLTRNGRAAAMVVPLHISEPGRPDRPATGHERDSYEDFFANIYAIIKHHGVWCLADYAHEEITWRNRDLYVLWRAYHTCLREADAAAHARATPEELERERREMLGNILDAMPKPNEAEEAEIVRRRDAYAARLMEVAREAAEGRP